MSSNPTRFWERIDLHKTYLLDAVRNDAYRRVIRRHVGPETSVLDVGSGTGILAFFAAQAGAHRVVAVEWSDMVEHARQTAARNGFEDRVEFIRGDIRSVDLRERFDLITHDLIGGMLWDENIVELLANVRSRFLAPGGRIAPYRIDLYLTPIEYPDAFVTETVWDRPIHGIDFGNLAEVERLQRPAAIPTVVHLGSDDAFLAEPCLLTTIDAYRTRSIPGSIDATFDIVRDGIVGAILGFFRIHLDEQTTITTDPVSAATNWGQFVVPTSHRQPVRSGHQLEISFHPSLRRSDWRLEVRNGPCREASIPGP